MERIFITESKRTGYNRPPVDPDGPLGLLTVDPPVGISLRPQRRAVR